MPAWRVIPAQVAEFLGKGMKRGALRTADPKTAAMHLLSLLKPELLQQRVLLGVVSSVRPEALNSAARRAIETFPARVWATLARAAPRPPKRCVRSRAVLRLHSLPSESSALACCRYPNVMGKFSVSGWWSILGWTATAVMTVPSLAFFLSLALLT